MTFYNNCHWFVGSSLNNLRHGKKKQAMFTIKWDEDSSQNHHSIEDHLDAWNFSQRSNFKSMPLEQRMHSTSSANLTNKRLLSHRKTNSKFSTSPYSMK